MKIGNPRIELFTIKQFFPLSIILFYSLSYSGFGQNPPAYFYQAWVLTKMEMKDSSSVINRIINDSSYMRFEFERLGVFRSSLAPFETGNPGTFTINHSKLVVSNWPAFHIEKLSQDELVILEDNPLNLPDDKVRRFYFTPETIQNQQVLNSLGSSDTIIANKKICPKVDGKLLNSIEEDLKQFQFDGVASGRIILSEGVMIVKVEETDDLNKSQINRIIAAFEKLKNNWNYPKSSASKIYIVEFYFQIGHKKTYDKISRNAFGDATQRVTQRSSVYFLPFTQIHPNLKDEISPDKRTKVNISYENGSKSFYDNDFNGAIKEFDACLSLDSYHIDSRYLRAYSYFKLSKVEEACLDLKFLASLNQKTAIQLRKEYCQQ